MSSQYYRQMFGDAARDEQARAGSRSAYGSREAADDAPDLLTPRETAFIAQRDSFYMASNTPGGWPYLQHRGGPAGFLEVLGQNLLGFADLGGNRQYISVGNIRTDDRVALFLMDYPGRRRLKLIGHAGLAEPHQGERAERTILIRVVGFDWNCPQHITPRFTRTEIAAEHAALQRENEHLRAEVARLGGLSR